ncbi:MAG TPA: adenylate/guanylate cyclase domain-containing protein [Dehalococcoidia bacterium]|nr:adenylate/guanylate cyclase domain-containing protein [Dehalococcoidia bacterium]
MNEPRIRYAKTEDAVSIGFCSIGAGPHLLIVPGMPFSHVQVEWSMFSAFYVSLAKSFTVTWYDARGSGVSNRDNLDYSMQAMIRDAEAIVRQLNIERVALVGFSNGALVATTFAVKHPELVSHLILAGGYVDFSDTQDSPVRKIDQLMDGDWDEYLEALCVVNGNDPAVIDDFKLCFEQNALLAAREATRSWDISSQAPEVKCPSLIYDDVSYRTIPAKATKRLAALIPGTQLITRSDPNYVSFPEVIKTFIGVDQVAGSPSHESAFRTILFTDLVGHTEMMARLGDERGRDVLRDHERITRKVLTANRGTEIKTMGDGFMASFGSVTKAVECAIALQHAFDGHEGEALSVRVGLNAGEPIEEDGDLFGATVILASRIAAKAEGGEVLVADTVRGLCSGKGFLFADRGEFVAKGFEESVRLYEVSWHT